MLTPTATITATETPGPPRRPAASGWDDPAVLADLHVGRIDPDIRPIAFNATVEKLADTLVDILAKPRYLAFGDTGHAESFDQVIDRPRRDALNIGFLNNRGQRLLCQPPWLQKAREIRAFAQFRDTQLDRPGPRLPYPIAVAVALRQAIRALLAPRRTRLATDVEFHEPFGGEAEHLTQKIGVGRLLQQPLKGHHLVGHHLQGLLALSLSGIG